MSTDADLHTAWREAQLAVLGRLGPGRAAYMEALQEGIFPGYRFPWRVAEAPSVVPAELFERDLWAMRRLIEPYRHEGFRRRFQQQVPALFRRAAGQGWFPRFVSTDFHRVYDPRTGRLRHCVPEIQSFPGNLLLKAEMLRRHLPRLAGLDEGACFLSSRNGNWAQAIAHLRRVVVADGDPAETAIVELDPASQKTVVDMHLMQRELGVVLVDLADLRPGENGPPTFRRAWVWEEGRPRLRTFDRPRPATRILCRALPDEIVPAIVEGRLEEEALRALFGQEEHVEWVLHPQDFFVLSKATLADHPECDPPLLAVRSGLIDALKERGLEPEDGFLKPAWSAGGRGLVARPSAEDLHRTADQYEGALLMAEDPAAALPHLALWQQRYPTEGLERMDVPGFVPDSAEDADAIYCELRIMWISETDAEGRVSFEPFTGLTRWARVGSPAHASLQNTAFTGTQGLLRLPDGVL